MPIYTYRREDGTTFDIRQKFSDDPLETDPETGQSVVRVIQPTGIVFKGSGFYVNDSKGSKSPTLSTASSTEPSTNGETKTETPTETKKDTPKETKAEKKPSPKAD